MVLCVWVYMMGWLDHAFHKVCEKSTSPKNELYLPYTCHTIGPTREHMGTLWAHGRLDVKGSQRGGAKGSEGTFMRQEAGKGAVYIVDIAHHYVAPYIGVVVLRRVCTCTSTQQYHEAHSIMQNHNHNHVHITATKRDTAHT